MREAHEGLRVARILRPRGNRGEVAAEDLAGSLRCAAAGRRLHGVLPDGGSRLLQVDEAWRHKGRLVLKFAGIDTISAAEELRGAELLASRDSLDSLPDDEFYLDDLVGCTVMDDATQRRIGQVSDVYSPPGGVLLVEVVDDSSRELLVPFVREFFGDIDLERRRLLVSLPDGLEELKS